MCIKRFFMIALVCTSANMAFTQAVDISYDDFFNNSKSSYLQHKESAAQSYESFREKANKDYIEFLKSAWGSFDSCAPLQRPIEKTIPPKPYEGNIDENHIETTPGNEPAPVIGPQPQPIEPIEERPVAEVDRIDLVFYGICEKIRMPKCAFLTNTISTTDQIAGAWASLCHDEIDNTLYDCLKIRRKYKLCDWAYLKMLERLSIQVCGKGNGSTLLMAFLYTQSGYQMRLALDGSRILMLYGSQHQIFEQGYFSVDGTKFYPFGEPSNSIQICNAEFKGEIPLYLLITSEQLLGGNVSDNRVISSNRYPEAAATSCVYTNLIDFYSTYPTSALNNNPMSRWAMYANTPLSRKTKEMLYPGLRKAIRGKSNLEAADILLNWVQTGLEYEYDDKIWGQDRAFFAEETLYYPYCDCEDRSILFSRLVRDLLGLDIALIYYPGHLATAVCFDSDVSGDIMLINNRKFIVCDPTYIGAPVGAQMPGLEYDKAQAIVLNK